MRVGITTATAQDLNIWSNGITQNVVFLARLMQRMDCVERVLLVDAGIAGTLGPQVNLSALGLTLIAMSEASDHVDVLIELGGALPVSLARLLRARGMKLAYFCVGQPYANLLDITLFDRPGHFQPPDRFDRVWLLPKDAPFTAMMRTLHRCPVRSAPYLWHPMFVQARMAEIERAGLRFDASHRWRNRKPGAGLRVAIFEPNLSPIKTSLIPMLIADVAQRMQPGVIDHLFVMNTDHRVEHPTLLHLGRSLDLVRQHKATFMGRHDVAGFMAANHIDVVVSHQWGNDQNYLYLDVLHGGYPLVHNSAWLGQRHGSFYPFNDIEAGARQLLRIFESLNAGPAIEMQRDNGEEDLWQQVSPEREINIAAYADLLADLHGASQA